MKNKEIRNTTFIAISKLYQQKNKNALTGNTAREKIKKFFLGLPKQLSVQMYGKSYVIFLEKSTFIINF